MAPLCSLKDVISLSLLLPWNLVVIYLISRKGYELMSRIKGRVAGIYLARKLIHILSGGLTVLVLPLAFDGPFLPSISAIGLALVTYLPHKRGRLMTWFQMKDNISEVYFALMWGLLILVAWYIDIRLAILPISFMAFGDGITGIVRVVLYSHRNKAWIGNLAMGLVCVPLGYAYLGPIGALAGAMASLIEHLEFIDDNLSIPLTSLSILLITKSLMPSI